MAPVSVMSMVLVMPDGSLSGMEMGNSSVENHQSDLHVSAVPLSSRVHETIWPVSDPTTSLTSWYRVSDVEGTAIETETTTASSGGGFSVLDDKGIGPTEVDEELWPRMPLPAEAALLELPGSVPVVDFTRWARHGDYVVEYARGLYVAPRFKWRYTTPIPD